MATELTAWPNIALDGSPDVEATPSSETSTIRVLHVINGEHYAGAERVQDLLAQRLGEFGFEVGFVALKPGRFAELRQAQIAKLHNVPMRSRFDLRPLPSLVRIIKENKYQIVHTHTARSAFLGRLAASIAGVPHVHHVHSPTSLDTTRWFTNRANMLIEKLSLRKVSGMIAVSRSLGNYVKQQRLGSCTLAVVPNGVPSLPLAYRSTPKGTWILGTVALFRPRKGLEVLLEALAQLRAKGLPVRLRAVGTFESHDYEIKIKTLADKLQLTTAIDWVGFCSDVGRELAKMDLFVLPSLFGEGMPMVVLEAMASGVPIVATRVEGVPEVIRDKVDGLIATPQNAEDLADRIADVVEGRVDWHALRNHAHERQSERFSDRSMASGVAEVYEQVLSKAREWAKPITTEITLLGTRIDNFTMAEAVEALVDRIDGDRAAQACFVNADCINITYSDENYRRVLANADDVFADGFGLKIAGKVLRQPVRDNVNGTDLFPRLCMALAGKGKRVYLLGGRPGVADKVGRWITTHFPEIEIAGTRDGYFEQQQDPLVIREIAESSADLLLVALGAPRQDMWIHDHLPELNCKLAMGVGGLFDFYSDRIPRAPLWMRENGMEWIYRMYQEPRRLAWRYLVGNPLFLLRVLRERFKPRAVIEPNCELVLPADVPDNDIFQAMSAIQ